MSKVILPDEYRSRTPPRASRLTPALAFISDLDPDFIKAKFGPVVENAPRPPMPDSDLFQFLLQLPNEIKLNDHGKQTLQVIRAISIPKYLPCISLRSFYKESVLQSASDTSTFSWPNANRFDSAFISPAILNLISGSVVGMNKSTAYLLPPDESLGVQLPPLFDRSVFDSIEILAQRGVTTILSIGNDGKKLDIIAEKYPVNLKETSAILVGGIKNENGRLEFDSNYGKVVTCYAKTPVKVNREDFGQSSAAMAIITGLVLKMQSYSIGLPTLKRYLTPPEIKTILQTSGTMQVQGNPVPVPTWDKIQVQINKLGQPART